MRTWKFVLDSDLSEVAMFLFVVSVQRNAINVDLSLFQANGIYTIAKLILPNKERNAEKTNLLQVTAFIIIAYWKSKAVLENFHGFKIYFKVNILLEEGKKKSNKTNK